MFESSINTRWYKIIESTPSISNILGPQAKFNAKRSCAVNSNERNMGASVVVVLGIIKISFVKSLNKSASICQAPLRPIKVGPIRR